MALRLLQLELAGQGRIVAALRQDRSAVRLDGVDSTYELANAALAEGISLEEAARRRMTADAVDVSGASPASRLLPPIDHPDPAHLYLTGTGLTHLGSAESRDKMHALAATGRRADRLDAHVSRWAEGRQARRRRRRLAARVVLQGRRIQCHRDRRAAGNAGFRR